MAVSLISELISTLVTVPNHSPEHLLFLRIVLSSEKLSEIKAQFISNSKKFLENSAYKFL